MVRKVLPFLFLSGFTAIFSQVSTKRISGFITDGLNPIENVSVKIKDTEKGVKSGENGAYEIYAEEGQTLVYSHLGKQSIEIIIEDVTSFLNITMYDDIENLDEVVVINRKKRTRKTLLEDYHTNKNLVKTAFGILDKERSGFSMRVIDGEQLSYAGQDFIDALQSWLPGIQIFRPTTFRPGGGSLNRIGRVPTDLTIPTVFLPRTLRSMLNPVPATFDVDGVIYTEAPIFIQVQNIERIAVLESLGASNRYGSLGVGGVIIINTKWGNPNRREPGTNKPYDHVKLRNNFFDKNSLANWSQIPIPKYLEKLYAAKTEQEARSIYFEEEVSRPQSAYFYLDARGFFKDNFDNKQLVENVTKTVAEKFGTDPTILKALAYMLEEEGEFDKAMELYKKVFILRPHYMQSYMDLANAYHNLGEVENAATLYTRYNYLKDKAFFLPSDTFDPIIHKNFRNLLEQNRSALENKYILQTDEQDFKGLRMVFEWNNSETEFELQFVSPSNQFYTTSHTLQKNAERIQEEKEKGFSCEEYLVYGPINGNWSVNVKYLGNKSATPTYLKTTVYHGFGTENQKKEVKVFRLATKNANLSLLRITDGSSNLSD
ncbi:carboxypeptidase-like regulatory domain-containing protein [Flagellimonas sp. 2504JD1-5]